MDVPPWELRRSMLVKLDEETNPKFGCAPENRPIRDYLNYGIINLDKPGGPSSHEVAAWVKRILDVKHAGHGGTLDPKVTGILPVALEKAPKVIEALLVSGKEYVCAMRLHGDVDEQKVRDVLEEFVGDILQRPPLRSSVRRVVRTRRIYYLTDLEFRDRWVLFRVGCQAGTYIRKLVYDVGEVLGPGAHMDELRRVRSGPFTEDESLVTLYSLKAGYDLWKETGDESTLRRVVLPMERALGLVPKIYVRDSAVSSIYGAKLATPGIARLETDIKSRDLVGFFSLKGELIALGKAIITSEEMVSRDHGLAADTIRVIMDLDTYPRMWQSRKTEEKP